MWSWHQAGNVSLNKDGPGPIVSYIPFPMARGDNPAL